MHLHGSYALMLIGPVSSSLSAAKPQVGTSVTAPRLTMPAIEQARPSAALTKSAAQVQSSPVWHTWDAALKRFSHAQKNNDPAALKAAQSNLMQASAALQADPRYARYNVVYATHQLRQMRSAESRAEASQQAFLRDQVALASQALAESRDRLRMIEAAAPFDRLNTHHARPGFTSLTAERGALKQAVDQTQQTFNQAEVAAERARIRHDQTLNAATASGRGLGAGLDLDFDLFGRKKSSRPADAAPKSTTAMWAARDQARSALDAARQALQRFEAGLPAEFVQAERTHRHETAAWKRSYAQLQVQQAEIGPEGTKWSAPPIHGAIAHASGNGAPEQARLLAVQTAAAKAHNEAAMLTAGDPTDPALQYQVFANDPAAGSQAWAFNVEQHFGGPARSLPSGQLKDFLLGSQALRPDLSDPQAQAERARVAGAVQRQIDAQAKERDLGEYRVAVVGYGYGIKPGELGGGLGNGLLYRVEDMQGRTQFFVDGLVAKDQDIADKFDNFEKFLDGNNLPGFDAKLAVPRQGRTVVQGGRIEMDVLTEGAHREGTVERFSREHGKLIQATMIVTMLASVVLPGTAVLSGTLGRMAGSATLTLQATMAAGMAYSTVTTVQQMRRQHDLGRPMDAQTVMGGFMLASTAFALPTMAAGITAGVMANRNPALAARAGEIAKWTNRAAWVGYVPTLWDAARLRTENFGKGFAPGEKQELWLNMGMNLLPVWGAHATAAWAKKRLKTQAAAAQALPPSGFPLAMQRHPGMPDPWASVRALHTPVSSDAWRQLPLGARGLRNVADTPLLERAGFFAPTPVLSLFGSMLAESLQSDAAQQQARAEETARREREQAALLRGRRTRPLRRPLAPPPPLYAGPPALSGFGLEIPQTVRRSREARSLDDLPAAFRLSTGSSTRTHADTPDEGMTAPHWVEPDLASTPAETGSTWRLSGRPTAAELGRWSHRLGAELAVTYRHGPGRNGGGGQYQLHVGDRHGVDIPRDAATMLIHHTHRASDDHTGPFGASPADRGALSALHAMGSPQRVSHVVQLHADGRVAAIADFGVYSQWPASSVPVRHPLRLSDGTTDSGPPVEGEFAAYYDPARKQSRPPGLFSSLSADTELTAEPGLSDAEMMRITMSRSLYDARSETFSTTTRPTASQLETLADHGRRSVALVFQPVSRLLPQSKYFVVVGNRGAVRGESEDINTILVYHSDDPELAQPLSEEAAILKLEAKREAAGIKRQRPASSGDPALRAEILQAFMDAEDAVWAKYGAHLGQTLASDELILLDNEAFEVQYLRTYGGRWEPSQMGNSVGFVRHPSVDAPRLVLRASRHSTARSAEERQLEFAALALEFHAGRQFDSGFRPYKLASAEVAHVLPGMARYLAWLALHAHDNLDAVAAMSQHPPASLRSTPALLPHRPALDVLQPMEPKLILDAFFPPMQRQEGDASPSTDPARMHPVDVLRSHVEERLSTVHYRFDPHTELVGKTVGDHLSNPSQIDGPQRLDQPPTRALLATLAAGREAAIALTYQSGAHGGAEGYFLIFGTGAYGLDLAVPPGQTVVTVAVPNTVGSLTTKHHFLGGPEENLAPTQPERDLAAVRYLQKNLDLAAPAQLVRLPPTGSTPVAITLRPPLQRLRTRAIGADHQVTEWPSRVAAAADGRLQLTAQRYLQWHAAQAIQRVRLAAPAVFAAIDMQGAGWELPAHLRGFLILRSRSKRDTILQVAAHRAVLGLTEATQRILDGTHPDFSPEALAQIAEAVRAHATGGFRGAEEAIRRALKKTARQIARDAIESFEGPEWTQLLQLFREATADARQAARTYLENRAPTALADEQFMEHPLRYRTRYDSEGKVAEAAFTLKFLNDDAEQVLEDFISAGLGNSTLIQSDFLQALHHGKVPQGEWTRLSYEHLPLLSRPLLAPLDAAADMLYRDRYTPERSPAFGVRWDEGLQDWVGVPRAEAIHDDALPYATEHAVLADPLPASGPTHLYQNRSFSLPQQGVSPAHAFLMLAIAAAHRLRAEGIASEIGIDHPLEKRPDAQGVAIATARATAHTAITYRRPDAPQEAGGGYTLHTGDQRSATYPRDKQHILVYRGVPKDTLDKGALTPPPAPEALAEARASDTQQRRAQVVVADENGQAALVAPVRTHLPWQEEIGAAAPARVNQIGATSTQPAEANLGTLTVGPGAASVTEHGVMIEGQELRYQTTAGHVVVYENGTAQATVSFKIHRALNPPKPHSRVVVTRSGGPISSGDWKDYGIWGPVRFAHTELHTIPEPGHPAPAFNDNPETILPYADLVSFGPTGVGYGRPAPGAPVHRFHGHLQDVEVSATVLHWLIHTYGWQDSVKVLDVASSSTFTAPPLLRKLAALGQPFDVLSGVGVAYGFTIGAATDWPWAGDVAYRLALPAYARLAQRHGKLSPRLQALAPEALQAEVAQFSATAFADALAQDRAGTLSQEDLQNILHRLSAYVGIDVTDKGPRGLRLRPRDIATLLLADEGKQISLLDARQTHEAAQGVIEPTVDRLIQRYESHIDGHYREALGYAPSVHFRFNQGLFLEWDARGFEHQNVHREVRALFQAQPTLLVVQHIGNEDLISLADAQRYFWRHVPEAQDRVTSFFYDAGHMPYLDPLARTQMARNMGAFLDALPRSAERSASAPRALLPPADQPNRMHRPFVLGYTGRIDPVKDLDLLLDTMHALRARAPSGRPVQLIIFGEANAAGASTDGAAAYGAHIRSRVRDEGLDDIVEFAGAYTPDDLPSIHAGIDALILTSRSEVGPLVVMEALSAGTPVVALDVGSTRAWVHAHTEGPAGIVVPRAPNHRASANALADAVARIAERPEEARAMSRRGVQIAHDRFSASATARQHLDLFRELATRAGWDGRTPLHLSINAPLTGINGITRALIQLAEGVHAQAPDVKVEAVGYVNQGQEAIAAVAQACDTTTVQANDGTAHRNTVADEEIEAEFVPALRTWVEALRAIHLAAPGERSEAALPPHPNPELLEAAGQAITAMSNFFARHASYDAVVNSAPVLRLLQETHPDLSASEVLDLRQALDSRLMFRHLLGRVDSGDIHYAAAAGSIAFPGVVAKLNRGTPLAVAMHSFQVRWHFEHMYLGRGDTAPSNVPMMDFTRAFSLATRLHLQRWLALGNHVVMHHADALVHYSDETLPWVTEHFAGPARQLRIDHAVPALARRDLPEAIEPPSSSVNAAAPSVARSPAAPMLEQAESMLRARFGHHLADARPWTTEPIFLDDAQFNALQAEQPAWERMHTDRVHGFVRRDNSGNPIAMVLRGSYWADRFHRQAPADAARLTYLLLSGYAHPNHIHALSQPVAAEDAIEPLVRHALQDLSMQFARQAALGTSPEGLAPPAGAIDRPPRRALSRALAPAPAAERATSVLPQDQLAYAFFSGDMSVYQRLRERVAAELARWRTLGGAGALLSRVASTLRIDALLQRRRVALNERPSAATLAAITAQHSMEVALTYQRGTGPNGRGGRYWLHLGQAHSVGIPDDPTHVLIYHTHPYGPEANSAATQAWVPDQSVLAELIARANAQGLPMQRSSRVVQVDAQGGVAAVHEFGPYSAWRPSSSAAHLGELVLQDAHLPASSPAGDPRLRLKLKRLIAEADRLVRARFSSYLADRTELASEQVEFLDDLSFESQYHQTMTSLDPDGFGSAVGFASHARGDELTRLVMRATARNLPVSEEALRFEVVKLVVQFYSHGSFNFAARANQLTSGDSPTLAIETTNHYLAQQVFHSDTEEASLATERSLRETGKLSAMQPVLHTLQTIESKDLLTAYFQGDGLSTSVARHLLLSTVRHLAELPTQTVGTSSLQRWLDPGLAGVENFVDIPPPSPTEQSARSWNVFWGADAAGRARSRERYGITPLGAEISSMPSLHVLKVIAALWKTHVAVTYRPGTLGQAGQYYLQLAISDDIAALRVPAGHIVRAIVVPPAAWQNHRLDGALNLMDQAAGRELPQGHVHLVLPHPSHVSAPVKLLPPRRRLRTLSIHPHATRPSDWPMRAANAAADDGLHRSSALRRLSWSAAQAVNRQPIAAPAVIAGLEVRLHLEDWGVTPGFYFAQQRYLRDMVLQVLTHRAVQQVLNRAHRLLADPRTAADTATNAGASSSDADAQGFRGIDARLSDPLSAAARQIARDTAATFEPHEWAHQSEQFRLRTLSAREGAHSYLKGNAPDALQDEAFLADPFAYRTRYDDAGRVAEAAFTWKFLQDDLEAAIEDFLVANIRNSVLVLGDFHDALRRAHVPTEQWTRLSFEHLPLLARPLYLDLTMARQVLFDRRYDPDREPIFALAHDPALSDWLGRPLSEPLQDDTLPYRTSNWLLADALPPSGLAVLYEGDGFVQPARGVSPGNALLMLTIATAHRLRESDQQSSSKPALSMMPLEAAEPVYIDRPRTPEDSHVLRSAADERRLMETHFRETDRDGLTAVVYLHAPLTQASSERLSLLLGQHPDIHKLRTLVFPGLAQAPGTQPLQAEGATEPAVRALASEVLQSLGVPHVQVDVTTHSPADAQRASRNQGQPAPTHVNLTARGFPVDAAGRLRPAAIDAALRRWRDQPEVAQRIERRLAQLIDPHWKGRRSDDPAAYRQLVDELLVPLMREFEDIGMRPAGTEGYVHPFRFFEAGATTPSWNVVGMLWADEATGVAHKITAHADGLSTAALESAGVKDKNYAGANDNAAGVVALLEVLEALRDFIRRYGYNPLPFHLMVEINSAEEVGAGSLGANAAMKDLLVERQGIRPVTLSASDMPAVSPYYPVIIASGYTPAEAAASPLYLAAKAAAQRQGDRVMNDIDTENGLVALRYGSTDHRVAVEQAVTRNAIAFGGLGLSFDSTYHTVGDTPDRPEFSVERISRNATIWLGALIRDAESGSTESAAVKALEREAGYHASRGEWEAAARARSAQMTELDREMEAALAGLSGDDEVGSSQSVQALARAQDLLETQAGCCRVLSQIATEPTARQAALHKLAEILHQRGHLYRLRGDVRQEGYMLSQRAAILEGLGDVQGAVGALREKAHLLTAVAAREAARTAQITIRSAAETWQEIYRVAIDAADAALALEAAQGAQRAFETRLALLAEARAADPEGNADLALIYRVTENKLEQARALVESAS